MRDHIIGEIRRLAASNEGQAPGQTLFAQETGIAEHQWRGRFWARWGDALRDAGLQPNKWNERHDPEDVLVGVIAACRHYKRLPTKSELDIYRRSEPGMPTTTTIWRHFKDQQGLIAALHRRAADDPTLADIAALLPQQTEVRQPPLKSAPRQDGFVYLIQSGEFFKIGRSDDIERRVKEITIALPDKATLVHSIRTDDPSGIEAYWHQRFKDRRANGEWFRLTSLDISAFRKRKFQ
jgi:hypothetical protein